MTRRNEEAGVHRITFVEQTASFVAHFGIVGEGMCGYF